MKKWLTEKDIAAKLVAVLTALILWSFVIIGTDPETTSLYTVQVEISNPTLLEEKGLVIVDGPGAVTYELSGKRSVFSNYSIDLFSSVIKIPDDISEGTRELRREESTGATDITITNRSSYLSTITVERLVKAAVPVEVSFINQPEPGYELDSYKLDYTAITIQGPRSAVEEIASVRVVCDMANRRDSFSVDLVYELLDKQGNVTGISKLWSVEPSAVRLDVSMKMESTLGLNINFIPTDYLNADEIDYIIQPANIDVYGDPADIEWFNSITLDDVSLKYVVENEAFVIERPIRIPDGITAAPDTPEIATITITIPGYERKVIKLSQDNLPADSRFTYPKQEFEIILFGKSEDIALIKTESITLTPVFPSNHEVAGEIAVPLNVGVKVDGVEVISKPSIIINILEINQEEVP